MKPEADSVLQFFLVISMVGNLGLIVKAFFFPAKPAEPLKQPVEVKASHEYIQRREFEEFKTGTEKEINKITGHIEKRFDDLKEERRESITNLHKHIQSSCDGIKDQITELDERYRERLAEGNHTMIEQGKQLAALEARRA